MYSIMNYFSSYHLILKIYCWNPALLLIISAILEHGPSLGYRRYPQNVYVSCSFYEMFSEFIAFCWCFHAQNPYFMTSEESYWKRTLVGVVQYTTVLPHSTFSAYLKVVKNNILFRIFVNIKFSQFFNWLYRKYAKLLFFVKKNSKLFSHSTATTMNNIHR
jgi:hypothetical protein